MARLPFSVEHSRRLKFIRDAGFIAGGRRGFYTVAAINDDLYETHSLWLFDCNGSGARRVGEELGDVLMPSASPDGLQLAVLSNVDGKRQVFVIPLEGGAARQMTSLPQGVSGRPVWSPDGRFIALTAGPAMQRDTSLPYRVDRVTYRFDGLGYLEDAVEDIYVVDAERGSVRQLTSDRCMNTAPRWSPDGRSLLYLVSFRPDRRWSFQPELHVLAVTSTESRVMVGEWGGVFGAEWLADGERIAFVCPQTDQSNPFAQKFDVWTVSVGGGEPECRTTSLDTGVGSGIQTDLPIAEELHERRICVRGDFAYVNGQVGGDVVIYRIGLNGAEAVEAVIKGRGSVYLMDFAPQSGALYLETSFVEPPELMLGATCITSLNSDVVETLASPDVQRLEVTASDGLRTDAWALTPPGKGPWPTILYIHGGPNAAFGSTYVIDFQLLVGAGFAVVFNNYRGSTGYGSEFLQKIVAGAVQAQFLDHHATLDEAVRAGIADPERLGVCGLSHGGFATCWLVGTSDRFKAAVAENPITSLTTAWGIGDVGGSRSPEIGTPHDSPDEYRKRSPLTYAQSCTTPVLFIVGEADLRCHPAESEQYYRVLKTNDVPSEMLRLPDTAHVGSWTGPVAARIAQNEALVEWFTRFLKAPVAQDNE